MAKHPTFSNPIANTNTVEPWTELLLRILQHSLTIDFAPVNCLNKEICQRRQRFTTTYQLLLNCQNPACLSTEHNAVADWASRGNRCYTSVASAYSMRGEGFRSKRMLDSHSARTSDTSVNRSCTVGHTRSYTAGV